MIKLTLPWPPSVNTIWRRVGAKTLLSAEGRKYRADVAALHAVRRAAGVIGATHRLAVHIAVHAPDKRRRDLDNMPKAIFDALTHAEVWPDDSQVDSMTVERMSGTPGGAITVTIEIKEATR